jgi:hypothetical protein
MNEKLEYNFKDIVIGGSVEALRHAWQTKSKIVFTKTEPPHFLSFDKQTEQEIINLCFDLSMHGYIPFPAKVNSIRVMEEDSVARLILQNSFININYEHAHIFSDLNVVGLPRPINEIEDYKVLDWIHMGDGKRHPHTELNDTESPFVTKIQFYPSQRIDGIRPNLKDAVAISYIKKNNLNKLTWSDSYARLKAIKMMKEAGIKFTHNKIETTHREVIPQQKNIYPPMKNITFYG